MKILSEIAAPCMVVAINKVGIALRTAGATLSEAVEHSLLEGAAASQTGLALL